MATASITSSIVTSKKFPSNIYGNIEFELKTLKLKQTHND